MKKYTYGGNEYDSLWQVRQIAPQLVFCDSTPERLLAEIGIGVREIPDPEPDPEAVAKAELEAKISQIDNETSETILAGFDYEIAGVKYHFNYDSFDQQNFADTANACLMAKMGMPGLPESVTWNGYTADGRLERIVLGADQFLALYAGGALGHKAACMEAGGKKKAELSA